MFRTAGGAVLRRQLLAVPRQFNTPTAPRRTLFTSPARKPRRFRNTVARWAIAIAGTYLYCTSNVFAEEKTYFKDGRRPADYFDGDTEGSPRRQDDLDAIRRRSRATGAKSDREDSRLVTASDAGVTNREATIAQVSSAAGSDDGDKPLGEAALTEPISAEELEEEADQQGAFNPETGEINWDCPCLGGMAHGPCGVEFRDAFSCFVYSTQEPKGVDCIEKFKVMQDCFRKFPEIYGTELDEEEESAAKPTAEDSEIRTEAVISEEPKIPSKPESGSEPKETLTT